MHYQYVCIPTSECAQKLCYNCCYDVYEGSTCVRGVQVVFDINIGIKLIHFAISLSLHTIIAQLTMCIILHKYSLNFLKLRKNI